MGRPDRGFYGYHRPVPTYGLVLTAAGASSRFGTGSKVLAPLAGVPVLARAARAFVTALGPLPTVVTVRAEDRPAVEALARSEPALAAATLVVGGATREESVARGLAALPAGVEVVLVHDAARPLVPPALVRAVAEAALRDGAAAPALPVVDSVHGLDATGRLVTTLDRASLRAVQTPQAARAELLRRAFDVPAAALAGATDEVGLLLAAGVPVTPVPGDARNGKVTTADDLDRMAARLAHEARG